VACQRQAGDPNAYATGNCTWWCFQQSGWVPLGWGNAGEWLANAQQCGYKTSSRPAVGAIGVWGPGVDPPWGYGHCALVTAVRGDGSATVSEMNWKGLGQVDQRNIQPNEPNLQGFILKPGTAPLSGGAVFGSSASSNAPDPFGINAATKSLTSVAQVGAGALIILAGLGILLLISLRGPATRALRATPVGATLAA
jgi:CHAP domain